MGVFKPMSKATVYAQEFHWLRSPEVWGTLFKVFLAGIVAGFILCVWAGASDVMKDAKANVPCKPTQTTSPDNNQPGSG